MNNNVSVDEVVDFLNELVEIDKDAIARLIATRVSCNESLADHPTVQVMVKDNRFKVGLLGIINGLFGVDEKGFGAIAFEYSDDGDLIRSLKTNHA